MNIFEEYMVKKAEIEPLRIRIVTHLQRYDIYSVETFLTLEAIIKHPNNPHRYIAKITNLSSNTIATIVLKLTEKGYITNEKDENDDSARSLKRKLLNPTPKGIEVYNKLMEIFATA